MKGWQIVIFGFLGCTGAVIFLIPLYYIILPFEWGGWIDGFPYSLIVSAPGTIVGSLIGILIGAKIGPKKEKAGLMVLVSSFLGGVLGSMMISFFTSFAFFAF